MNRLLPTLFALLAISSARAEDMPLVYSLGKISIQRATQADGQPTLPLQLSVQIRDAESFYRQNGWFNVGGMKDGNGVLLLFAEPAQTPIEQMAHYAPMDILMVDEMGDILSIAPSLVLAELQGPIYPPQKVKAFLLLAGGSSERLHIQPNDTVTYPAFKKPPPVIDKPQEKPVAAPAEEKEKRLETPEQPVPGTPTPPPAAKKQEEKTPSGLEELFAPKPALLPRRKPVEQPSP